MHHRTIQINRQPDAKIFQFIILTFIYSSTCFGRFPAHHQQLNDCSGSLWFYLRIVVTVVLCSWSGRSARPQESLQYTPVEWAGQRSRYSDWLRAGRSGDRIPVESRFSAPVQTGPGAHPTSCTMGTGSFPGVKSSRGLTLTLHPLLVPLVMKEQSYTSTPLMGRTACTEPQCLYKGDLYFTQQLCLTTFYSSPSPLYASDVEQLSSDLCAKKLLNSRLIKTFVKYEFNCKLLN